MPAPAKNPPTLISSQDETTIEDNKPVIGSLDDLAKDPILLYLVGMGVGAEHGLTFGFHFKTINANQRNYSATKEDGVLTVSVSVDDFIRKNAEIETRKCRDAVNHCEHMFNAIDTQVSATKEAYEHHTLKLSQIDKKQKDAYATQEKVIESWKLTLEEIQPRYDSAKEALDEANKQFKESKKTNFDKPNIYNFDLNNLPF